jgi:glycosyltransferase involved in cell wall biosynthesis
MNHSPLLSVIVANYNNATYVRDCLDSILGQTYKNVEIIVSDDASIDNSPEIIREYETKYPGVVKGIFSAVNRGVAITRHEAILQAKGEYITSLDSDDYYSDPRKLQMEMELIINHKNKTSRDILAFSNIVLVKADRSPICILGNETNIKEGFILKEILSRTCMIPRDYILKKVLYFEAGGYDPHFPIYEDWDLKIRMAAKYEYYYTGISGTAYRRHGTGLSSIPLSRNIKWLKKVFKKNLPLVGKERKKEAISNIRQFIKKIKTEPR